MMLYLLIDIVIISLLTILINSPGELPPLKDEQGNTIPGPISEKIWIEINGIRQGMFTRGENPQSLMILCLYGDPGTPILQFIIYLEKQSRLEKYFTVYYWNQCGSGMSYTKMVDPVAITTTQLIEDTHGVAEYLKSHFDQGKIYLIGHSWGSYLGVRTIEKYPEDYPVYIGTGQATNQVESERLAYDYM